MPKKQKLLILFFLSSAIVISLAFLSGPFLTTKLGAKTTGTLLFLLALLFGSLGKSWKKIVAAVLGARQCQGKEFTYQ